MTNVELPICTLDAPTAKDLTQNQRLSILGWLEVNGGYRRRITAVELDLIDAPIVRVHSWQEDADGHVIIAEKELVTVTTEHLLRVPPPSWWQPAARSRIGEAE